MTMRFVMLVLLLAAGTAGAQPVDPPARVARLGYAEGDVSFSPAGEDGWYRAQLNRPQVAGDRLWVARRARAELQVGGAALRLDEGTGIEILTLDDRDVQVELTQGTLNLHVRRVFEGQSFEVATPTLALVVRQPGDFRIDVDDRGTWTEVVAWRGAADVYGDRARFSLREGDAVRFDNPRLRGYHQFAIPPPDSFDRFVDERNRREERSLARRYVPDDLIGYSDLDDYGRWSNDPQYGALWYPRVAAGWAPYRDGRWIWQDPWGWTWVDNAPWGFAPFHYGRWLRVNGRWAWVPVPTRSRPVYSPALVAFVGGGGGSIGWFPLGPSDVYVPGYRVSQSYWNRVNDYRWIDNRVSGDLWSGYSRGRPRYDRQRYSHRDRDSMTVVARDAFVNGRDASRSRQQAGSNLDASAQVSALANMAPVQRSLAGGAQAATVAPDEAAFDRRVMARRAPQMSDVPFERRAQQWQRNPGQPIAADELARMRGAMPADEVKVVGEAGADLRGQAGAGSRANERSRRDEAPTANAPADEPRGRGRGRDDGGGAAAEAQRAAEQQQRDAEQQRREVERQQQEAAMEQQRAADQQRREGERARRDAERGQQQAQMDAQREAERLQREADKQQQRAEQAERESRARYEQEQRDRERESQQRATEAAERQAELERRQAEADAQRDAERQAREAERAERDAAQAAERAQQEAAQAAERAQQEAQREAERQARDAEQSQREAERAQREADRDAQREEKKDEREERRRGRDRDEGGDEQPE